MTKFIGTSLDDTLQGTAASDVIDGRAGKDKMIGGDGGDTYYVDNLGDSVVEAFSNTPQIDTVISTVALTNSILYVEDYIFKTKTAVNFLADGADNVIEGGSGNDIINAGDGLNRVYGNTGNDTLAGGNFQDNLDGGVGNDLLEGGGDMDTLNGGAGDDILEGGGDEDLLDGGTGKDQMTGGDGSDTYYVDNLGDEVHEQMGGGVHDLIKSTISITELAKWVEDGQLLGSAALNLTGNDLNNWLGGNDGANVIDGGAGADQMAGGKGGDTYIVDNLLDQAIENAGQGIDLVKSTVSFTLGHDVENLILSGSGNIGGWGNDLDNVLTGNDGNNTLNGFKGDDTLIGGKGDDYYVVDSLGDKVVESVSNVAGGGTDTIVSTVNFSLTSLKNVENLHLDLGSAISAIGNALDNTIMGNDNGNVLDGGAGADMMYGYKGHDTYYVDNVGDVVVEVAGEGIDTIISKIAMTGVVANVENYAFETKTGVDFKGDGADNTIFGSAHDDTIQGGAGLDTLWGGFGDDKLIGGADDNYLGGDAGADEMTGGGGNDTYFVDNVKDQVIEQAGGGTADNVHATITIAQLWDEIENAVLDGKAAINVTGNALANRITGNDGANVIDGGANGDAMAGGKGNDTYIVEDIKDTVSEKYGEGTDLVKSSVSFTLDHDIENLTLTGIANINGTGNGLANVITGNDKVNVLDGGFGADTLAGGKGDDYYMVDDLGDKVVEIANASGGGHDHVYSSVSFSLAGLVNVEDVVLTGTTKIDATGNALDNYLQGNDSANVLDGGKGADILEGYGNDDTYYVDNAGDQVFENAGGGDDTIITTLALTNVVSEVENYTFKTSTGLNFTGSAANNWIEGGSGSDTFHGAGGSDHLYGNGGNDILIGGGANDTLDGGTGADVMQGFGDNDVYWVDNAGDKVIENWNDGLDTVGSTISLAHLFDNVEGLYLMGSGNINGTGNDLDNLIYGNHGNNVIDGGAGKDEIYGQQGNDTLTGGTGADQFDFYMTGNDGHDTIKDFLKAEDVLMFGTGDQTNDGKVNIDDILAMVDHVVDHGQGKAVDVFFNNGAEITFQGCGTAGNAIHQLTDLVDTSHIQVS